MRKKWLVTGVSSGFGRCFAEAVCARGDYVIGTVRKESDCVDFNQTFAGKGEAVMMDMNYPEQIKSGVAKVLSKHQTIDILVNNAGYGLFAAVEEASEQEVRQQMETNFFGPLFLTQALLPSMRAAQSGYIVQISSIAGLSAMPGLGIYNASKFALEGMSEALSQELAPLGIKVLIVEPGPFRTKWGGGSSRDTENHITAYEPTAHAVIKMIHDYDGKQPGDPQKAVELILEAMNAESPPLRLPLGQLALERVKRKMESVANDVSHWQNKSSATDFST